MIRASDDGFNAPPTSGWLGRERLSACRPPVGAVLVPVRENPAAGSRQPVVVAEHDGDHLVAVGVVALAKEGNQLIGLEPQLARPPADSLVGVSKRIHGPSMPGASRRKRFDGLDVCSGLLTLPRGGIGRRSQWISLV
jgi:hypothetical protein